jgi:hypothetical protein
MSASMNHQSKFGIVAAGGGAVTSQYKFRNWQWTRGDSISEDDGISGTRSHHSERKVQNVRAPAFSFEFCPNSVELDTWLPYILGGSESTDSFPLAETLPDFDANYDMGGTRRFYLGNCKVDRAVFSGRQGEPLRLQLFCEALTITDDATAFPSLTINTVPHYIYSEGALVVNSQSLRHREWSMEVNNALVKDRWLNSQTRISLPEGDRIITWTFNGPYGDNTALYNLTQTGVACTATFTKGNRSLLFSSSKVSFPVEVPSPESDRGEIMLPLVGMAAKDGSTLELVTTNDSSP